MESVGGIYLKQWGHIVALTDIQVKTAKTKEKDYKLTDTRTGNTSGGILEEDLECPEWDIFKQTCWLRITLFTALATLGALRIRVSTSL